MGSIPKFLCDHMLGTLARWLRILGFDASYPGPLGDDDLVSLASQEGRVLLTRDKDLGNRKGIKTVYISSDLLDEQMGQVLQEMSLTIEDPMSRCPVCNDVLARVSKAEAQGKVPAGVYARQEEFWRCPGCGKYYWQGSHWERMTKKVEEYEALTRRRE